MADTKLSALPLITTVDDTDEVYVNDGGSSKRMTMTQLTAYIESRGRQHNASVANQTGFAADTYLTGSSIAIPNGRLQAKSKYRARFNVVKTAAGVVAPVLNLRFGTAGSTADTARATLTFAAQTAVVDEGFFEIDAVFRTVGSGTSAILQATGQLTHRLAATGFSTSAVSIAAGVSGTGFDSTVANSIIGLSVNGGTSAAWTVNLVDALLENLN